nr:transcription factor GTE12-like [Ipomoea batatas]
MPLGDPLKQQQERERLEIAEKARIEEEIKAAQILVRMRAEADLKIQREAARIAFEKMEKTVEFNDAWQIMRDFESLLNSTEDIPTTNAYEQKGHNVAASSCATINFFDKFKFYCGYACAKAAVNPTACCESRLEGHCEKNSQIMKVVGEEGMSRYERTSCQEENAVICRRKRKVVPRLPHLMSCTTTTTSLTVGSQISPTRASACCPNDEELFGAHLHFQSKYINRSSCLWESLKQ